MLTEIALTPHALQPCTLDGNGWAGNVRALNTRLGHYAQQCPLIFSNLNAAGRTASWEQEVRKALAGWKPNENRPVRDLFDYLVQHKLLVARPAHGQVKDKASERNWVDDATKTMPAFPISQVVVSRAGEAECRKTFDKVVGLHSLEQAAFWSNIVTAAEFGTTAQSQVLGLRPIWLHAQFISVVLPYGLAQEADWFFELATKAFNRPLGHGSPKIEFHVSFDGNGNDLKQQGAAHSVVANFIDRAQRQVGLRGRKFTLVMRAKSTLTKKFIARRLFAGEETIEDPSKPEVRVRWGIALEHVGLRTDAPDQTPPTFTLLPRPRADDQFRFECRELGARLIPPIPVQC